ncbi:hypothetical protein K505DRAFT_414950 [Melanomma pulvis-pyrius CBS 109.77]|uniref:Clr5 domain-containing protein n=1 Tax=Melanomma pulvis-pyrius CBS 109.77 TaxID=1314802 RepID=A0A6A6XM37_9PLEO|nr:hypothetical protein K505DRAFT_414950 [Melanomma pulvis-pyrius CBS 109.77]
MRPISFVKPNVSTLSRADRIAEGTWERYRTDIIREYVSGGSTGNAQALRWIKKMEIPGFDPNSKQLRHRIREVWKEQDATKIPESIMDSKENMKDDFDAQHGGKKDIDTNFSEDDMEKSPFIKLVSPSLPQSPMLVSQPESLDISAPRTDSKEMAITTLHFRQSTLSTSDSYQRSTLRPQPILVPHDLPTLRPIPEEGLASPLNLLTSTTAPTRVKRRGQSLDENQRERKRHNEGKYTEQSSMASPGQVIELEDLYFASEPMTTPALPESSPPPSSTAPHTADGSVEIRLFGAEPLLNNTPQNLFASPARLFLDFGLAGIKDPVYDPRRLQGLLSRLGFEWNLDAVTRNLRKNVVFRVESISAKDWSTEQMQKVKAFAEYLFASSVLEDAFPLFLLVWITRREHMRDKQSLIQCARSAVRSSDRVLVRALLEQNMSLLDTSSTQSKLLRSSLCLELASVIQQQGYKSHCTTYQKEAIGICPPPSFLLDIFDEAQQQIPAKAPQYYLRSYTVRQVFLLMGLSEGDENYGKLLGQHEEPFTDQTLSDVLLAVMYLMPQGKSMARNGASRLRNCLKHAIGIFKKQSWRSSHERWLATILGYWPECPCNAQIAVFLDLLMNWSSHPYPSDDPEFRQENSFNGLSTIEIISALAFLVLNNPDSDNDIGRKFYASHKTQSSRTQNSASTVKDRAIALLELPDDQLLEGFLFCSLKLSSTKTPRGLGHNRPTNRYKDLVADMFAKSIHVEIDDSSRVEWAVPRRPAWARALKDFQRTESMMSSDSASPTLARSLSTCSTLSSMRRQSRMTYASFVSRLSNRTTIIDELTGRFSRSTISDGFRSRPVSGNEILDLDAEEASTPATDLAPPVHRPIEGNPKISLPTLSSSTMDYAGDRGNARISLPVQVVSSSDMFTPFVRDGIPWGVR